MKVCFIAGTLGRGGAERQLHFMLRALQSEDVACRVLCLTRGESYEKQIESLGIQIEYVGSSRNRIRRLTSIIDRLRSEPADILQSSHFFSNIYAALAGRVLGIPSIGAVRGDLMQAIAANGYLGNSQLKWPHHLIANSQRAVTDAIQKGIERRNIDFLRNVVDLDNGAKLKKVNIRENLTILFVGRLVPLKRPDVFLKLASKLRRDLPDSILDFRIAGDGPLRRQSEQLGNDLGLFPDRIKFFGEVHEMDDIYENTDILVLTSMHEGTPNVILEAMSYGIPVVATKVGGVPEVLSESCGIMVDPDDFGELCAATSKLILDGDLRCRMGRQAQEYVRKNHSIGYLQEKLKCIYSGLLQQRGASAYD